MPIEEAPIEPADLVVLAIGIAVTPLGAAHLIAHLEHRCTDRDEQNDKKVLDLTSAQLLDGSIVGSSFGPAVPGQILVEPVAVAFVIRLIVLTVVRDQIAQREAVVAGNKINALFGFPFLVAENVRAAKCALRQ